MSWVAYTDGGCKPNPGRGGFGVVLLCDGALARELSGGEASTSSNRMELTAAIAALRAVPDGEALTIHVDSTYVKDGITKWLRGWRRKGWRTKDGQAVKNRDLWEALAVDADRRVVEWRWVRAHEGDRWNERADELATAARRGGPAIARDPIPGVVEVACAAAWIPTSRRGGWSAVLRSGPHKKVLGGHATETSANRMHVAAALRALESLKRAVPVQIACANDYVVDGATKWLAAWRTRNWLTAEKEPVTHRDLWEALAAVMERLASAGHPVEWLSAACEEPSADMAEAKARANAEARGSVSGDAACDPVE
ncbi:MAG: ribonuclease HI [Planctomycetes bacterium]|nr:ribonuclease HI [Planctomycetota bacterium]